VSVDATRWAWLQDVSPAKKLVLLALADRADENHVCYPSNQRICSDTGLHRETVFKAIDELEKDGLLSVSRELGKSNRFTLNGVDGREKTSTKKHTTTSTENQTSSKKHTSTENQTSSKKHTSTENQTTGSTVFPTGVYEKPDTYQSGFSDTNLSIEPNNNLKVEPNNKAKKKKPHEYFVGVNPQVVDDYLEVRKAKKAPAVSQTVFDGLVRESQKAGYTMEQALITCCERNWVGFKAEWIMNKSKTNLSIAEQNEKNKQAAYQRLFGSGAEKDVTNATV